MPQRAERGQHALVAQGIPGVIDAFSSALEDILQAGIQPGFRILIEKLMRGGDSMDRDLAGLHRFSVIEADQPVLREPFPDEKLLMGTREHKPGPGAGVQPDFPGRDIHMIRMVVRAEKQRDAVQLFSRNRRRDLSVFGGQGIVIDADQGAAQFHQEAHLAHPPQCGGRGTGSEIMKCFSVHAALLCPMHGHTPFNLSEALFSGLFS